MYIISVLKRRENNNTSKTTVQEYSVSQFLLFFLNATIEIKIKIKMQTDQLDDSFFFFGKKQTKSIKTINDL